MMGVAIIRTRRGTSAFVAKLVFILVIRFAHFVSADSTISPNVWLEILYMSGEQVRTGISGAPSISNRSGPFSRKPNWSSFGDRQGQVGRKW